MSSPDEVLDDPSGSFRSMSKEALLAEAKTKEHLASHFPFNPYCPICNISCMKQKRHGRTKGRGEDVAKQWTAPIQRISTDTMSVSLSDTNERASASGNNLCTTIRDMYSGVGTVLPGYARNRRTSTMD